MEIPHGVDDVSAAVYDPDGNLMRSTFRREGDGLFHLRFTPTKVGQHKVNKQDQAVCKSRELNVTMPSRSKLCTERNNYPFLQIPFWTTLMSRKFEPFSFSVLLARK